MDQELVTSDAEAGSHTEEHVTFDFGEKRRIVRSPQHAILNLRHRLTRRREHVVRSADDSIASSTDPPARGGAVDEEVANAGAAAIGAGPAVAEIERRQIRLVRS